jgi:exopolysaccharide biosynthesis protein
LVAQDIAAGLDLWELSEIMLEMGQGQLVQAVNLDGGGSSVTVYEGEVISTPTCVDTATVCERAVTTILCVKGEEGVWEREEVQEQRRLD